MREQCWSVHLPANRVQSDNLLRHIFIHVVHVHHRVQLECHLNV